VAYCADQKTSASQSSIASAMSNTGTSIAWSLMYATSWRARLLFVDSGVKSACSPPNGSVAGG